MTGEGGDGEETGAAGGLEGEFRLADPDSRRSRSGTLGSPLDLSPEQKQTIRMSACCPFDPLDSPERQTDKNTV